LKCSVEIGGRLWAAEVEALHLVAAVGGEEFECLLVFDALGDD
jgi:hypothetical protein